jgi:predicted SAM-dependent methyltransferase
METKTQINLGCGLDKRDGFWGIDKIAFGHNTVVDIEKDIFPIRDNWVDYILCKHALEHLTDSKNCLNECWRVLKPEGTMEIIVPHGQWEGAYCPDHKQFFTPSWFGWLARGDVWERYGYREWEIVKCKNIFNDKGIPYQIQVIIKPKK